VEDNKLPNHELLLQLAPESSSFHCGADCSAQQGTT